MPLGALSSQVEKYCLLGSKNPIVHSSETSVNNRARPVPAVGNGFLHDKSKVHVSRSSFKRVQSPGPINATQPEWVSTPPGWPCIAPAGRPSNTGRQRCAGTGHSECSLRYQVQWLSLRWGRPFSGSPSASAAGPLPDPRRSRGLRARKLVPRGQLASSVWLRYLCPYLRGLAQ